MSSSSSAALENRTAALLRPSPLVKVRMCGCVRRYTFGVHIYLWLCVAVLCVWVGVSPGMRFSLLLCLCCWSTMFIYDDESAHPTGSSS